MTGDRVPSLLSRDLESLANDTYRKSGVRGGALGAKWWGRLVEVMLAEFPLDENHWLNAQVSRRERELWAELGKARLRRLYGIDPITILLISIAARLAVELIIWWLQNRGGGRRQGLQMRDWLRREHRRDNR